MLTYPLNKESGRSLYEQLYEGIRRDILSGTLPAHQRLPSKRALAQHLEVSIITVQNAYEQLAAEGYIYSQEKRGYYVSPVERPLQAAARQPAPLPPEPEQKTYFLDLVTNSIDRAYFPFTVWARLMRETLLERDKALLQAAPYNGAEELRRAISDYLRQFRGMNVDSGQIIVGAPAYRGGKLFRHRPGASAGGTAPSGASLGGITMYDELTRGDVQKMQEEIDYRTQVLRPKLIEDVQTARAFGDLSENFEYKCAKQEKNRNDSRIRYLQRMIKTARIIDDRSGQDTAGLYDTVEIFMENTGKSRRIQLVTTLRQDALKGLISKESPVGKAVLGRRVGDRVQVDMGGGRSYWITIRSIEKGTDDGSIPIGSF